MKKFMQILYIKFTILRISLFKNLTIITSIFLIVISSLIISGAITEDTPLIGWLFGGLSEVFNDMWNNIQCKGVVSAMAPVISILGSVLVVVTKLKSIGLTDVKSKKVKISIARCGLVLNNRGFLVKRDKIKSAEVSVTEPVNVITDALNTIGEIGTILTAKVDTESSDEEILNKIENPVIEKEIVESKQRGFMGIAKSVLSGIWSGIKDFIAIFKKENYVDENDKELTVESTHNEELVITDEMINAAKEELKQEAQNSATENIITETVTVKIDTTEIIDNTQTEEIVYDDLYDVGDQILVASQIADSNKQQELSDTMVVAATVDNIIEDVKEIKNNINASPKPNTTTNKSSASNLLAKLNANRK